MLRHTFLHLPGIGRETERRLWGEGCLDWDSFLAEPDRWSVGSASRELTLQSLEASKFALELGNYQHFVVPLGLGEAWRAWEAFGDSCAYVDIETDGGQSGSAITMIGLADKNGFKCYVRDDNLLDFVNDISHYSMIVTFFGAGFDLPMIRKRFRNIHMDQIHLDLCPTLRQLGYRGGLKKIEKQLGIQRGDDTDGLNGQDAIRLWRAYERGSKEALEQLIAYNREDVVNMETLARIAVDGLKRHCGFSLAVTKAAERV